MTLRPATLNFPARFHTSIRHVVAPFDALWAAAERKGRVGYEYEASPWIRIGPLELGLATSFRPGREGRPAFVYCLSRRGHKSVPWTGTVEARFRFLDAEGKLKHTGPIETVPVAHDNVGSAFGSTYGEDEFEVLRLIDQNALCLEVLLDARIKLIPGLGGEDWEIPNAVLHSQFPTNHQIPLPDASNWTDVEFESRDGDKFKAHRMMLAGISKVFKTMFEAEMKEKAEGVVKIADMGSKAVKIMIKFIYGRDFREEMQDFAGHNAKVFLELVNAGKKYEMRLLMTKAGVALMLRCTRENVLELFSALKPYGKELQDVMVQIADFIKKNVDAMAVATASD